MVRPSAEELVARYGSPLYVADLDRVRFAYRTFLAAFRKAWPNVVVAYSCKTNHLGAILRTLHDEGAEAEVVNETEYVRARAAGFPGRLITFNGPAKPARAVERALAEGALVQVDRADELDGLAALTRAGYRRRVGLRVATEAGDRFGVPAAQVETLAARGRRDGLAVESLSVHLPSVGVDEERLAEGLGPATRHRWPKPAEPYGEAAALLAGLARRLRARGVPIARLDLGGGLPAASGLAPYVSAITAALSAEPWDGDPPVLALEPGRALVHGAVDLLLSVVGEKRLPDGTRAIVLDGGTDLLPGVHWRWPELEPLTDTGSETLARVFGPLCLASDILHPGVPLPPLRPRDLVAARGVGAYHLAQASQFGGPRPAVIALDRGRVFLARRAETVDDLIGLEDMLVSQRSGAPRGSLSVSRGFRPRPS